MFNNLSNREKWFLVMVLFLLIGFFLQNWAAQKDMKEYKEAYAECMRAYNQAERGVLPLWSEAINENFTRTINVSYGQN